MSVTYQSTPGRILYKLVLTGGPCGGKTTCQARLSSFFENLGWKVFRVPEAVSIYLGGGLKFAELSPESIYKFQSNLIKNMVLIEDTFKDITDNFPHQNVLMICDRGVMDATAYLLEGQWEQIRAEHEWDDVALRDKRYDQVIHMVTAANGAERFYTCENSLVRSESPELAVQLDEMVLKAWIGHPYVDIIDNSTGFEEKVKRVLQRVCERIGVDVKDRLAPHSRKRKFRVSSYPETDFPVTFHDFDVVHYYLVAHEEGVQARIRMRGQNGNFTYLYTVRRAVVAPHADASHTVESKRQIQKRDFELLLLQRDVTHLPIHKKRRCFQHGNAYYQLDVYDIHRLKRSEPLCILETFTSNTGALELPDFLTVDAEVTNDRSLSMFNLSKCVACDRVEQLTAANSGGGGGVTKQPTPMAAVTVATTPPAAAVRTAAPPLNQYRRVAAAAAAADDAGMNSCGLFQSFDAATTPCCGGGSIGVSSGAGNGTSVSGKVVGGLFDTEEMGPPVTGALGPGMLPPCHTEEGRRLLLTGPQVADSPTEGAAEDGEHLSSSGEGELVSSGDAEENGAAAPVTVLIGGGPRSDVGFHHGLVASAAVQPVPIDEH